MSLKALVLSEGLRELKDKGNCGDTVVYSFRLITKLQEILMHLNSIM